MNIKVLADERVSAKLYFYEKQSIRLLVNLMKSGSLDEGSLNNLETNLRQYYFIFCNFAEYLKFSERICSLLRVINFLLKYPVKNRINPHIIEQLYSSSWLLNMATYNLSQISEKRLCVKSVEEFLGLIKGTSIERLSSFWFYRNNPAYMSSACASYKINEMTKQELYYGVTTGFYRIRYGTYGTCDAIERLHELSADDELEMLARDGYWIL